MVYLHVFLLNVLLVSALYSSDSEVVQLTAENFEAEVLNSNKLWIVEFYAPWCGHCKSLAPEFDKAARALKGFAKLGAVDMTVHAAAGSKYNIQGYPTLKFFGNDKKSPEEYSSGRTAKELVSYIIKKAEEISNSRIGVKASQKPAEEKKEKPEEPSVDDKDVVVLTVDNFDSLVLASDDLWLVEFYAPWCGHCKQLAPEWAKAATELKGSVKVGKVDATVENALGGKYAVQGYPTIKFFVPGGEAEEYKGGRVADSIVTTALEKLESIGKSTKLPQLTDDEELKSTCEKGVCILAFLPHIYDSSADERNRYLDVLGQVRKQSRGKPVKFLWAQAGDFYKFEQVFGVGSYPVVLGVSLIKSKYAVMRSAFNLEDVGNWVKKLMGGSVPLSDYKELPKLAKVAAWDGLDHVDESVREDL